MVNGARGFVDSIQANKEDPDVAEVIWVRFNDDAIGQLLRIDSKGLLNQHKPNDPLAVPIIRQKKQFSGRGNTEYLRDQFPLTLCYAVTSHKSQGQTLDEVLIDFSDANRINNGSFYTALSRVKYGSNLYLKEFKPEYIKANPEVEKKMESMKIYKNYNFLKILNTESIFESNEDEVKLGYININDIFSARSIDFLNKDTNLLGLDFLVVADTRLQEETDNECLDHKLSNWIVEARFDSEDKLKHMGMLVLKSKLSDYQIIINVTEKPYFKNHYVQMQVVFISFTAYNLESAFVYTRETPSQAQLKMLKKELKNIDLAMGDLNLDPNRSKDVTMLDDLCNERKRVLNELTTIRFNQLDHILLNDEKFPVNFSTSYINHTTDHHTIVVRIGKDENRFKQSFLEKITFDEDAYTDTRKPKRRKLEEPFQDKNNKSKRNKQYQSEDLTMENNESSDEMVTLNLTCLFSPNWLYDDVIDSYLKLFSSYDSEVFTFTTYFYNTFSESGFEGVKNYYRRYDLLSFKTIFIPVHYGSHWFLITYNGSELESYDAYNYPGATPEERKKKLEKNYKDHEQILKNLRDNYWKPLYRRQKQQYKSPSIKIHIPPLIPSQDNDYDCGVFLLTFAKCILFKKAFNFSNDDMLSIRDQIRTELENKHIAPANEFLSNRTKRKRSTSIETQTFKKKLNSVQKQRRIINPDSQTCWLNSCLQLVLTAIDHLEDITEFGSDLWNQLIWLQGKDPSVDLDPTDIKNEIIKTEQQRIIEANIPHSNMLFDLGNLPIMYEGGSSSVNRIGQQDCQDFFLCLDENRELWSDVFNLFKVNTLSMTECVSCENVSKQDASNNASTMVKLECPHEPISMKQYIEQKMNDSEEIDGWRDEDGCGLVTKGKKSEKIANIEEVEFIIFRVQRLIQVDQQQHIIRTQIRVDQNEEVNLIDANGISAKFLPISIIHHRGNVVGKSTEGHYLADVKNIETNSWYRTSDNDPPVDITHIGLTKMGYIFLYKKSRNVT